MSATGARSSANEASGSRTTATRNGTRESARLAFGGGALAARHRSPEQEKAVEVTPEMLAAERSALLAEKQKGMDRIVDRHDDLVREMFQMENFINMLLYDPKVAKEDHTAVFRGYKARYDLVDNTTPVAGPSRQTRGRLNERRQIVQNSTISAPPTATPAKRKPKTKNADALSLDHILASAKGHKGNAKAKADESTHELPEARPEESASARVVDSGAKTKGKGRAVVAPELPIAPEMPPPESAIVDEPASTIIVRRQSDRKNHTSTTPQIIRPSVMETIQLPSAPMSTEQDSISTPKPLRRRANGNTLNPNQPATRAAPVPIDVLEQAEKSNAIISINRPNGHSMCPPLLSTPLPLPDESISSGPTRRSGRLREPLSTIAAPKSSLRPLIKLKGRAPTDVMPISPSAHPPPSDLHPPHSLPLKLNVKRIKLIVRRPPPSLTNPKQRAPPPKHNSSLTQFLTSYISLNEEEDAKLANLQQEIKAEAEIRERVQRFRVQGRFIPGTDVLFGTQPHDIPYISPMRTTRDTWDDVVQAVVAQGRSRPKRSPAKQITAQIASKVQAHFDGQESKKLKAKETEEKRLRNLAKSTMKLVIAEWKKAVYHIREKQRLEVEAEERRLGHIHLDAILNQSGAILETQQGDLSRRDLYGSRSRSGSIGDFFGHQHQEEDEDEEDDDDGEGDQEGEGSEEDEDEVEDCNRTSTSLRSIYDEDEEDGDGEADGRVGTTSMLLDAHMKVDARVTTGTDSSPTTRSGSPASSEGPDGAEDDPEDPEVSATQRLDGANALNDLLMYADSASETDLEDLLRHNSESSPQRHQQSQQPLILEINGYTPIKPDVSILGIKDDVSVEPMEKTQSQSAPSSAIPAVGSPARHAHSSSPNSPEVGEIHIDTSNNQEEDRSQVENNDGQAEEEIVQGEHAENDAVQAEEMEDEHSEHPEEEEADVEAQIPEYLQPYAVAPVEWDPETKVTPPLLLRGVLRPYQQSGLEWLASLHLNKLNGILADEMGLGKTIQTISLLAHLACDRGIWGPHLIVVPTSVLLNWEMEFKKFLPGFRVLSYHGSTKRRKELRQGWNDKHHFNVCITSYTLASRDAHIFKRKAWYYMILDEAHMIKNFKSQRWNILLMFRSYRRLLLTGTPLQNSLTELWALLQFLMSGANFANLKEFGEWFSNPLEKAIEMGNALDDETMQRVSKLHTVLRPYLLRRLKRDVEKELPSKFEHLTLCPLSKRQRFLYDEFMSRAQTRDALDSGVYQKIANILMQLRKVCNHPDLFEVRPIVTSFAMSKSAIADFEIKELLVRRRMFAHDDDSVNLDVIGLRFIDRQNVSLLSTVETRRLDSTNTLPCFSETAGEPPPKDTRTIAGHRKYSAYIRRASAVTRWAHTGYLNKLRCSWIPIFSDECISVVRRMSTTIIPFANVHSRHDYMEKVDLVNKTIKSYATRAQEMAALVDHFAFITPTVVALDLPRLALSGYEDSIAQQSVDFDAVLHRAAVKRQIAFPDPSLLQYDCGKLQKLATLLRERKAGGHRILIFTQMTRILDILEIFLNLHGYLYLRLDGATKIEDRQYITERFNADPRIFCFIASSRSGGVGINLTGADTVVFYDSDFNPQMDRQCEDRAHRIGQIRDVHIYRFVSQYTVEEAMLLKANQKRSLDDLVIQKGEFDWRSLFTDESALTKALGDFEDAEDRHAAAVAAREEFSLVGADEADFGGDPEGATAVPASSTPADIVAHNGHEDLDDIKMAGVEEEGGADDGDDDDDDDDDDDQGGSVVEYMLAFVEEDYDYFREWWL